MIDRFVCSEAIKRNCTVLDEESPTARDICDPKLDEKAGHVEIPLEAFLAALKVNES